MMPCADAGQDNSLSGALIAESPASLKLESIFRVAFTPFHKSALCEAPRQRAPIAGRHG
jgi:hypothetical protein